MELANKLSKSPLEGLNLSFLGPADLEQVQGYSGKRRLKFTHGREAVCWCCSCCDWTQSLRRSNRTRTCSTTRRRQTPSSSGSEFRIRSWVGRRCLLPSVAGWRPSGVSAWPGSSRGSWKSGPPCRPSNPEQVQVGFVIFDLLDWDTSERR